MIRFRTLAVVAALTLCLAFTRADVSQPKAFAGAIVMSGNAGATDNPELYVSCLSGPTGYLSIGDAIAGKLKFTGKVASMETSTEPGMTHYTLYAQGQLIADGKGSPGWARLDITVAVLLGNMTYHVGATLGETRPTKPSVELPFVSGRIMIALAKTGPPTQQPGQTK